MIKLKQQILFVLLVLAIVLGACSGTDVASPVVSEPAPISEAETLNLAAEVDVQTVAAIQDRDDVFLLDVREQWEYDEGHIPNITLIPMGDVPNRLDELPTDKAIIVTCRSGNRSGQVTKLLRENGFDNVHNMQGGILDWEKAGYQVER